MKRLGQLALKIGLQGMELFDVDPPAFGHDFPYVRHPQDVGNQIQVFFGCGTEH